MLKNYTHNELLDTLQKLTGKKPTQQSIANAIGCELYRINKRASRNSKYSNEELIKIGNFFNVSLVDTDIVKSILSNYNPMYDNLFPADFYPDELGKFENGSFKISENKIRTYISKDLIKLYSPFKTYFVINAYGDSMNPDIKNGDKLIIEKTEDEMIKDNQIYVFFYNGQIFVKRLIKNIEHIIIKSDNPSNIYNPEFITQKEIDKIKILGRVTGLIREVC